MRVSMEKLRMVDKDTDVIGQEKYIRWKKAARRKWAAFFGRGERTRTSGPMVPNHVL